MIPTMLHRTSSFPTATVATRLPAARRWGTALATLVAALSLHAASPDTAQQAYRKGDYQKARREYDALLQGKPDDPRYQFNAGAAAYRTSDFTNAVNRFEATLASPDLKLQEKAYYNLGNTRYQMGYRAQDPQVKLKQWQQALTDYTSALKLDATDTNAASNLQYVKTKVEELMRQQPPSQRQKNQDQNQDKNKNQDKDKDKQDQEQSPDSKSDQQKDQNQSQESKPSKDSKDSKDKDDTAKSEPQSPQDGNPDKQDGKDPSDSDSKKQEAQSGQKQDGKDGSAAGHKPEGKDGNGQAIGMEEGKAGEMSRAQAAKLLDEQKGDEKALVFQPGGQGKRSRDPAQRSRKTW
jgi:Ca-activated chloride channel family protein